MANGGTGIPFPEHSRPRPGALLHAYRMDVGLRQGTRMTTLSPSTRPETACTEPSSQTSSNSRGSSPSKVYNGPPAKSMTSSPSVNTADFGSGDFGASFLPYKTAGRMEQPLGDHTLVPRMQVVPFTGVERNHCCHIINGLRHLPFMLPHQGPSTILDIVD